MNIFLKLAAIAISTALLLVAVANINTALPWMVSMILISSTVICVISADIIENLKKVKAFTLIELIAVITIMAVLLTMITAISKPDRAKRDTQIIGGIIKLYQAKAYTLEEGESYSIHIGDELTVTDQDGLLLESETITAPIKFLDNSDIERDFIFNHRGEVVDLSKVLRFKIGEYKVKVNNFTGKFSYFDELAEY